MNSPETRRHSRLFLSLTLGLAVFIVGGMLLIWLFA